MAQAAPSVALRTRLEKQELELGHAELAKDNTAFQRLLAPELIYVAFNGWVFTKKDVLQKSGYLDLSNYHMANFKLRPIGRSGALLTYDLDVRGHLGDKHLPSKQYASSVWVKTRHGWQLLFHQATPAHHD